MFDVLIIGNFMSSTYKADKLWHGLIGCIMLLILNGCNLNNSNNNTLNLQSKYIQIGNQNIHYLQTNNNQGSPIVLLTGVGTTSSFWNQNFINCLAQNHQLYLLDYPGTRSTVTAGESISVEYFATITNDFVQQKRLQNPSLLGWSIGGSIALQASFFNGGLYKHLYLLSGYIPTGQNIFYSFSPHSPFKNSNDVLNYVFNNNLYAYTVHQLNFYSMQLISQDVPDIFTSSEYLQEEMSSLITWGNNQSGVTSFKLSIVPATFIIPDNDTIINENVANVVIESYNGSKNIIHVNNSGHDVSLQYPEQVCSYIN